MSELEREDAELAEFVRQLLEMEVDDDDEISVRRERPSRRETAATLPSMTAVSDVEPEQLPPTRSSRVSVPGDAGRYSLITARRRE
jgi:hypothetical protein